MAGFYAFVPTTANGLAAMSLEEEKNHWCVRIFDQFIVSQTSHGDIALRLAALVGDMLYTLKDHEWDGIKYTRARHMAERSTLLSHLH
jgi:hypothetical protein